MSSVSAGIDFGPTDSAVAVSVGGAVPRLVSFDGKPTIPSALFYPDDKSGVLFGEQGSGKYQQVAQTFVLPDNVACTFLRIGGTHFTRILPYVSTNRGE